MKTTRHLKVPTGDILTVQGEHGPLELLSIGDYGKETNLKCSALGIDRDIERVTHGAMLPLEKKWVITISTQYGCSMGCTFCDVPKVGPGKNATFDDLVGQVMAGVALHPEVERTERLNIHYARMGEPTWNPEVIASATRLHYAIGKTHRIHPVVSTMMPRHNWFLAKFLDYWMGVKNGLLDGEAGLQISINSTSEAERATMFNGNAQTLAEVSETLAPLNPRGRKITLNFAVAGYEIDPAVLLRYFDPARFIVKLTPMHKTAAALANGIETAGDYATMHPYREHEEALKTAGFDVLVFIASEAEDLGLITCGNAILSGSTPSVDFTEMRQ
jgi:23S rRNA (adenine2503-C2)-methyltransferase